MSLDWLSLRNRLQRCQRDGGGRCSVIVRLKSGDKFAATITDGVAPANWPEGEMHLSTTTRTGVTTHIIDVAEIAAVAFA